MPPRPRASPRAIEPRPCPSESARWAPRSKMTFQSSSGTPGPLSVTLTPDHRTLALGLDLRGRSGRVPRSVGQQDVQQLDDHVAATLDAIAGVLPGDVLMSQPAGAHDAADLVEIHLVDRLVRARPGPRRTRFVAGAAAPRPASLRAVAPPRGPARRQELSGPGSLLRPPPGPSSRRACDLRSRPASSRPSSPSAARSTRSSGRAVTSSSPDRVRLEHGP